jgi:FkbM family methyltransferase
MLHDLLRITVHAVVRHPGLLFVSRSPTGSSGGWYSRVRDSSIDRVQADFFAQHPDGVARVRDFAILMPKSRSLLCAKTACFGDYEPRTSDLVRSLAGPETLVVDAGANVGWFTLLAAKNAKQVWAFEPEPSNFELLRRSIALNGYTNVEARQLAVSATDGEIALWLSEYSTGLHSTVRQSGSRKVTVACQRLDSLFPDAHIGLLKIDVEGAEPEVLAGASRLIATGRIDAIVMEWNAWAWKQRMDLLAPFDAVQVDGRTPYVFRGSPLESNVLLRPHRATSATPGTSAAASP